MAETRDPCTLPKDMRCCAGGIGYAYVCHGCGWMAAEQERRHALPLVKDEDGLRRRHVGNGNQPEEQKIDGLMACRFAMRRQERKRLCILRTVVCKRPCAGTFKKEQGMTFQSKSKEKFMTPTAVRIRITKPVELLPELRPTVGAVYDAERWPSYTSPVGGYVIVVGGKRINIRRNECIEV